jgi:hypothetical protein
VALWIDALASRSGPLLHAAAQFTAAQGLERDPPRGVAGLGALTRLIGRARAEQHDGEHARVFLEGAGAYLALLLLDHLPDAAHTARDGEHRLRLGDSGCFDPFAAVAHALDAEDAPRTLLEEVQLAEAEAHGRGPTARVVSAIRRALSTLPEARVAERFDRRVWVDLPDERVELDLTRVIEITQDEPAEVLDAAVRRLCASLLLRDEQGEKLAAEGGVLAWAAARGSLYPRLVGPRFIESLAAGPAELQLTRIGSEVWDAMVLRSKQRARFVRAAEWHAWSGQAVPRTQALQNLARSSEHARFLQHDTRYGRLISAQTRDGLDAARLLLPGLYELLAASLGERVLVAIPHRDTLLACSEQPLQLVAEFERRVAAAMSSTPHAISARPFRLRGPCQLEELDPSASHD